MEMEGQHSIGASRNEVWRALNDLDVLRDCIPGCTELVSESENNLKARITLKIGSIKVNFFSNILLSEIDQPNGYVLSGKGEGGAAGFAKGKVRVRLNEEGESTLLHYTGQVEIGGKIAQLGSRLIDATSRKYITRFFEDFVAVVEPEAAVRLQSERQLGWSSRLIAAIKSFFGMGQKKQ